MDGLSSEAVKAQAAALGFDLCGMAPVDDFPELAFLREWLDRGYAGEMAWMARTADRRRDVRAVMPQARSVIVTGTLYNTDRPYSDRPARGRRPHLPLRLGRRLSRRPEAAPRRAGGVDAAGVARAVRCPDLRGHRPRAGARVRPVRRAGVDRQEHVSHQRRAGLVAVPGRGHHQPGARAGHAGPGAVRHLHALPGGVSDRRAGRAWRARLQPLPVVSDHRAAGADPRAAAARAWRARLRLRHLPGRLPLQPARAHLH